MIFVVGAAAVVIRGGTGSRGGTVVVIVIVFQRISLQCSQYGATLLLLLLLHLGENDGGGLLLGTSGIPLLGCGGFCRWHGRGGACSFFDGDVTAAEGG